MQIKTIQKDDVALPVDIAVINAVSFHDALNQIREIAKDGRVGLVVWAGAGDLIPQNIKSALMASMDKVGFATTKETKTKVDLAKDGLAFDTAGVKDMLHTHFANAEKHAVRDQSNVFDEHAMQSHVEFTTDFLSAFNSVSPVQCYSRLDRLQKTNEQSFFHRDRLTNPNECRIFRNIAGAGTVFVEEANIAGMGWGGALGLKDYRNAIGWMLAQWDVGFLIPNDKGGMAHSWPSLYMDVETGRRHFETMDVTLRDALFKPLYT